MSKLTHQKDGGQIVNAQFACGDDSIARESEVVKVAGDDSIAESFLVSDDMGAMRSNPSEKIENNGTTASTAAAAPAKPRPQYRLPPLLSAGYLTRFFYNRTHFFDFLGHFKGFFDFFFIFESDYKKIVLFQTWVEGWRSNS